MNQIAPAFPVVARTSIQSLKARVLIAHCILMAATPLLITQLVALGFDQDLALHIICAALGCILLWLLSSLLILRGSIFNPYGIFLVAAILFHAMRPMLYLFGWTPRFLDDIFPREIELKTSLVVTLGLLSMHLGAILAIRPAQARVHTMAFRSDGRGSRAVAWLLVAVAIIPAALQLRQSLAFSMTNSYGSLYRREAVVGIVGFVPSLANFLVPGTMFVLATGLRTTSARFLSAAMVGILVMTNFFLGYRGQATLILVAYAWLVDKCIWKIPRFALAGLCLGLLTLYPIISVTRDMPGEDRFSPEVWLQTYQQVDNPLQSSLAEMGGTLKTVAYVVQFVPETRNYDWGRSYLWALFSLVPNFTSDLHPSARRSISLWLITTVDPYIAARGGGLGFSFLAEAYLNFGWAGIVIIGGLVGFFLSSLDQWVEFRLEPMVCACVAVILVFFPKYARADSLEITRAMVWYCLVPYLCCIAFSKYRLYSGPAIPELRVAVPRWQ